LDALRQTGGSGAAVHGVAAPSASTAGQLAASQKKRKSTPASGAVPLSRAASTS
jgi:hypothetical protein